MGIGIGLFYTVLVVGAMGSVGDDSSGRKNVKNFGLIRAYYLGSPLFLLVDLWWGVEVRVTFLPDPLLRFGYYVLLSGLGLLTHFRPETAPYVALGESSLNLLLIMLWILMPIYHLADAAAVGGGLELPYTPNQILVNGLLAGGIFVLGFYRAQRAILARFPWLGTGLKKGPGSH